ncbi:hypothetical protein BH24ACT3_BH24ACT3_10040 [soil metagenome]
MVVLVAGIAALFDGALGAGAVTRAKVRTAADAAALAGAAHGRTAAEDLAVANGGELVRWLADGAEVEVTVRLDGAEAVARAERVGPHGAPGTGGPAAPGGSAGTGGLTPGMVAALARAEQLLGGPVPITSGWRSRAAQETLWRRRDTNGYPVARPGTSSHERGVAVDVPRVFVSQLLAVAPAAGLCQPLPVTDPIHFELCGARR